MKITRRTATLGGLGWLASGALSSRAVALDDPLSDMVEGAEDFEAASDAYIFGYSLVTMEMTRRVFTNVAEPKGTRGPMGQIIKLRSYPDASFRDVTAPNADTLYTTAFFDVGDEAWGVERPGHEGALFPLPFLDGWTNVFAVPGEPHHRDRGSDVCHHRAKLVGCHSRWRDPAQIADRHGLVAWAYILHRHARGLRRSPCAAGSVQAAAAEHLGKDYTPPAGKVDFRST